MTDKPEPKDAKEPRPIIHLGKIGDGTEEQNLGARGDPEKRITQDEKWMRFSTGQPKEETLMASACASRRASFL